MYTATNKSKSILAHTVIAFVFLMDEALFPVFHLMGIPFKVSYVFLLLALVCYIFSAKISNNLHFRFAHGSEAKKVVRLFFALILLSCLGEMTMLFFSKVSNGQPFADALLNYCFMVASFILGYSIYRYRARVLLWALYIYSAINIALLMFYSSLPGFITSMYGEYYATGIRIRGTGGNANATLLVMNMILLSIVVLFKYGRLRISGMHVWLVLIVPILTNVFVSSRGEFVHTVLLELFYIYVLVKNEKNKAKTLGRIIGIIILILAAYIFVFHYLYNVNDSIRYGIDRLSMLGDVTDVEDYETGDADTILRPFFRADVFWARFKHSPLWGAGYSYGTTDAFIKSANGYHNDWFRVLASTGILGFGCLIAILKRFVKKAGVFVLLPLFIAGLTNTFLQSTHALNIYFFLFGTVCHLTEAAACSLKQDTRKEV